MQRSYNALLAGLSSLHPSESFLLGQGLTRSILQTAALSAVDYCYRQLDCDRYPAVSESAFRLLQPSDGDLHACLDQLIVAIRNGGWSSCTTGWFEASTTHGAPLTGAVSAWVRFRNDRPGHGVVSPSIAEDWASKQHDLCSDLLSVLADLIPRHVDEELELNCPSGQCGIDSVRMDEGSPIVLRDVRRRGGSWSLRYQVLSVSDPEERQCFLTNEVPLVALATEGHERFAPRKVELSDGVWTPLVSLPSRETALFSGREAELQELHDWYIDEDSRACLVHGEGGIGKTTLVLEFLNDLLEGGPAANDWRPEVIFFFTAKQTRWGPDGLTRFSGVMPAITEALRQLSTVLGLKQDRSWYTAEPRALLDRVVNAFREAGLRHKDLLIVLDNTETLARSPDEEAALARLLSKISARLGRVLMTSRRRERVEAHPIAVQAMSDSEASALLRKLGSHYDARPIADAGEATLRRRAKKLGGRPLLIEVFARHAARPGSSLDAAEREVMRDAADDLGAFLFDDAWNRIGESEREVFLVLAALDGTADDIVMGWICQQLEVPHSAWEVAFEETHFGILRDYGVRYDVYLDPGAVTFLTKQRERLPDARRRMVDSTATGAVVRRKRFHLAEESTVSDRVAEAFRTAAARAAKLAASAGAITEAKEWYEEAVRSDRDNPWLWDRYAWFLAIKGDDLDRARECAAQALELRPDDREILFTAGLVAARRGEVANADKYLAKAERLKKPAHLCRLQAGRARLRWIDIHGIARGQQYLADADGLISEAKDVSVSTRNDRKHLRECDRQLIRIARFKSQLERD